MPSLKTRYLNPTPYTTPTIVTNVDYSPSAYETYLILTSTDGATKTITLPAGNSIRRIFIRMAVRTAGAYGVTVGAGTVTFDAANEAATFISESGTTGVAIWQVESLFGATFA